MVGVGFMVAKASQASNTGKFTRAAKEERRRLVVLMQKIKATMDLCTMRQRITEEVDQCTTIQGHRTLSHIILKAKESLL